MVRASAERTVAPAAAATRAGPREQTRARYPDRTGFVERDGVRTHWEVCGNGEPAILFAPTWSIVHSRIWKAQVPYFARRHKVVTVDARGNGASDRPATADAYNEREIAADLLATLDATGTERAVVVSLSLGAQRALVLAAEHPERVHGLVFLGPAVPLGDGPARDSGPFDDPPAANEGWALYNRHAWRRDYARFLEFFFGQCFNETHSTKQIEDAVGWGGETDGETLIRTEDAAQLDEATTRRLCNAVVCPTLVIQGEDDAVTGRGRGVALAEAIPEARLVTIAGGGHILNVREPVLVNHLIRDFVRAMGTETVP
ncbi:MAG: alpha/beta hydrolase [Chloroflexota bacterium]